MRNPLMNGLNTLASLLAGTLILIAVLLTALFWVPNAYGAETVEVTGYGTDRESAMEDARRVAVSSVLGEAIASRTLVENYALVSDRILSSSSGYVSSTEIVETSIIDDLVMVRVRATVEDEVIGHDVDAIRVLSANRGNPRFCVVIDGGRSGDRNRDELHAEAARGVREYLTEHGFELVSLPALDIGYAEDDPGVLATVGREAGLAGAEFVILLSARVLDDSPGRVFARSTAKVDLQVIHTGSYRVISQASARGSGGDEHEEFAALDAARHGGVNAAQDAATAILNDWTRQGSANGNRLSLTLRGLPGDDVTAFTQGLLGTGSVRQATLRSGDERRATFEIVLDGTPGDLAEAVEEVLAESAGAWALTGATGSSLTYQVIRN